MAIFNSNVTKYQRARGYSPCCFKDCFDDSWSLMKAYTRNGFFQFRWTYHHFCFANSEISLFCWWNTMEIPWSLIFAHEIRWNPMKSPCFADEFLSFLPLKSFEILWDQVFCLCHMPFWHHLTHHVHHAAGRAKGLGPLPAAATPCGRSANVAGRARWRGRWVMYSPWILPSGNLR